MKRRLRRSSDGWGCRPGRVPRCVPGLLPGVVPRAARRACRPEPMPGPASPVSRLRVGPRPPQPAVSVRIVPPRNIEVEQRAGAGAPTGLPTRRQSMVIVTLLPAGTWIGVTKW